MKNIKTLLAIYFCLACCNVSFAQQLPVEDTVPQNYFVTYSKVEYMQKLHALPCGIQESDNEHAVIIKLSAFLNAYHPSPKYPDDKYALASALQALASIKGGGYGIGAVLIDSAGNIIAAAHNNQIQLHRSDLHAEMSLLTQFEESKGSSKYLKSFTYKPGLTVFSSAEPCPMCFMRLAIAGVDTKYCSPGPDDGMVNRVNCLPPAWVELAAKHKFLKANTSPTMQKIAHLLFFSFLLDNRGPKS